MKVFDDIIDIASEDILCIICGNAHLYTDCDFVKITNHVPDSEIPSRAKLSLPDFLRLQLMTDGSYSVTTTVPISKGTEFGPFLARRAAVAPLEDVFLLKIHECDKSDVAEWYLDTSNENECNWLKFVSVAEHLDEQNLVCYEKNKQIFYAAMKDIDKGISLKVWYSPFYGQKLGAKPLTPLPIVNEDWLQNIDYINCLITKQQNIVDRKVWACKFCGAVENTVVLFAKHILTHYTAQMRKVCEICDTTFAFKQTLEKHLRIVHTTPISQQSSISNGNERLKKRISPPQTEIIINNNNTSEDSSLGGPLLNDLSFTTENNSDLHSSQLLLEPNSTLDVMIGGNNNNCNNNSNSQNHNNSLLDDAGSMNVDNFLTIGDNVRDLDHFNFEIEDGCTTGKKQQCSYDCDICQKQFGKLKWLVSHLRHHTGEFTCTKCLKIFARKESLEKHRCNITSYERCNICDKQFTCKKYLRRHLVAVHEQKFKCDSCGKRYNSQKELSEHNCEKIPLADRKKFVCSLCSKVYLQMSYLKKHMTLRHSPLDKARNKEADDSNTITGAICPLCGAVLQDKNSLGLHLKTHMEPSYSCEVCSKKFYRADALKFHKWNHEESSQNQFKCPTCNKRFKTNKYLKQHLKLHDPNGAAKIKSYKCDFCQQTFKQRIRLVLHMKLHNQKIVRESQENSGFSCQVCQKSVKFRKTLLKHMRLYHPEENRAFVQKLQENFEFECQVCQKRVQFKKSLQKHMEHYHPEENRLEKLRENFEFECQVCLKKLKTRRNLLNHMENYHPQGNNGRTYQRKLKENFELECHVCRKRLRCKDTLVKHIKHYHPEEPAREVPQSIGRKSTITSKDKILVNYPHTDDNKSHNGLNEIATDHSMQDMCDIDTNITNFLNGTANDLCWENWNSKSTHQALDSLMAELNQGGVAVDSASNHSSSGNNKQMLENNNSKNEAMKEYCLSIPDLMGNDDQEITLGENAFILDNTTIVQPHEDSGEVIVNILNQQQFSPL